jgi:aspartate aminotransferase-like enzyme/ribosomal protein S18 acetylase RimI-like enzyme
MRVSELVAKIADTPEEFGQIARLNYATFVEEIPQHQSNSDRELVDKFHQENTYFIVKVGASIAGMLALRNQRPFSLDAKLPNLDDFLLPDESLCEIRLLAIEPSHRHSRVLRELFLALFAHCVAKGFDRALISGRLENIPLYTKLGFQPFSEPVGSEGARYQPMYMTRETANRNLRALPVRAAMEPGSENTSHCFLPGPVALHPAVEAAVRRPVYSHRSQRYATLLDETKDRLRKLSNTQAVEILVGTGTLANDVVGAHIAELGTKGLILSNGEFGERLVAHAQGFGISHVVHQRPWGQAFDLKALAQQLKNDPGIRWLWCVQCETSTGRVNPIEAIQALCDGENVLTHFDAISALGVVPCDWSRARMVSGVSGKGLGALTGLAMVFYDPCKLNVAVPAAPQPLPRYLDVRAYADKHGRPYSGSSLLLEALASALRRPQETRTATRMVLGEWLEERLQQLGLSLVVEGAARSPSVFTIALPAHVSSRALGDTLMASGLECSYASDYLLQRNWLQICLMGEVSRIGLELLCEQIANYIE